jgi:hypothetical protein
MILSSANFKFEYTGDLERKSEAHQAFVLCF